MAVLETIKALIRSGEKTKRQAGSENRGVARTVSALVDPSSFAAPASGTYQTYRQMRGNPTIALARIAATAPIRIAEWGLETNDDAPGDAKTLLEDNLNSHWPELIKNVLFALDYGWQPFEKVWEQRDGKWVLDKIKPLLPDKTEIIVEESTGRFAGVRQGDTTLAPEYCFVFTNDGEAGNFYGRSRHENCRETAWHSWKELNSKLARYVAKVAGTTPIVKYVAGESQDATGSVYTNDRIAAAILNDLGKGSGVAFPKVLAPWAETLLRQGVNVDDLLAWDIDFLEPAGQHGGDLIGMMRHYESLMVRAWLVPERAITEGQFGTKAEAEAHADIALTIADLLFRDICRSINKWIVNPLLIYNFDAKAKGSAWLEPAGLSSAMTAFIRSLISSVLGAPVNVDMFLSMLDVDTLLDQVGLPKAAERIELPARAGGAAEERITSSGLPQRVAAAMESIYREGGNGEGL